MKIGHEVNSIVINKHANCLNISLIADGVYRPTSLDRNSCKSWLAKRHRCRQIVTKRVLYLRHRVAEQELVSFVTTKMIAIGATPELGLVLQGILMIRTSVETKHNLFRTTEISTLKPRWGTSCYNECQAKLSDILVSWTSIKLCLSKRKVENVDSQSNNQKLNV